MSEIFYKQILITLYTAYFEKLNKTVNLNICEWLTWLRNVLRYYHMQPNTSPTQIKY